MKYNYLLSTAIISGLVLSGLFFTSTVTEAATSNEESILAQEKIIQESTQKQTKLLEIKQTHELKQRDISKEINSLTTTIKEKDSQVEALEKITAISKIPTLIIENNKKELRILDSSVLPFTAENNTTQELMEQSKAELETLHKQQSEYIEEKNKLDTTQNELSQQLTQLTQLVNDSKEKKEALEKALTQQTGTKAAIVEAAKSHLGKPYVYGAAGPDTFDCSGLVQVAFASAGRSIGRTTIDQESAGTPIPVSEAQAGDLVFWGSAGGTHHVGISLGDNTFIHAPVPGDVVKITSVADYSPDFALRV